MAVKRRMRAADRRAQIVQVALEVFGARGYDATRLDDVAAAAGVTKPILYRHFASKRALYLALLRRHEDDLPTFVADGGDVDAILARWLAYVQANSASWLVLFRDSSGDAEIRAARAQVSHRAREVLAGFVAGAVPDDEIQPTAEALSSGLAGLVLWWIDNPDVPQERIHAVAARMVRGVLGEAA